MKLTTKPMIAAFSLIAILALGTAGAKAQTAPSAPAAGHEEHHPEGGTSAKEAGKSGMMNGDMMGNMDMDQMKGMMHECMEAHKDGKMCEHQTMEKCQEKMGKGECGKMMKHAKKADKKSKKK